MGVVEWPTRKSRLDTVREYETAAYAVPRPGDTKRILGPENIFDTAYRDASTFANVSYPQSLTNPLLEVAGTSP